MTTMTMPAIA